LPQAKSGNYLSRFFVQVNLANINYRKLRKSLSEMNIGARNGYPGRKRLMELPLSSKMKESDVVAVSTALKESLLHFDKQTLSSGSYHHS
jgi:hypothetical protein